MLHRAFTFALLLLLAATARAAELPPALKGVHRILFLGDSITFGGGHIDLFEATLLTRYPDHRIEVLNLGLGSETASGQSEILASVRFTTLLGVEPRANRSESACYKYPHNFRVSR